MRGVGILQLLMLLLFCACSEDDQLPENTATVLCSLTSDNRQSLNGRLVFDRAYVHLSGIEVSVYKDNAQEFTSENFDETQQFFFIGSDPRQPIPLQLPEATYTQPHVRLFFAPDSYILYVRDTVYGEPSGGNSGSEGPDNDGSGNNEEDTDEDDDDDDSDDDENGGTDEDEDGDTDKDDEDDGSDDSDDGEDDGEDKDKDKDKSDKDKSDKDKDKGDKDKGDKDKDKGDKDKGDKGKGDKDGGRNGEIGKTVDLSDFLLHAKPSLVLLGTYATSNDTVRVIAAVEMNTLDLYPTSNAALAVKSSDEIFATIVFNPGDWFDDTFEVNIANAHLIRYRDQKILLIHREFNAGLYQGIQDKIASASRVEFSLPGNEEGP